MLGQSTQITPKDVLIEEQLIQTHLEYTNWCQAMDKVYYDHNLKRLDMDWSPYPDV